MIRVILLCALVAVSTAAFNKLELSSCGGNGNIRVNEATISPMPVRIPGTVSATVDVDLSQRVDNGAKLKIDMSTKTWLLGWIPIPFCIKNIGSCEFNVCDFLQELTEKGCPKAITDLGYECWTCPFEPKHHRYVVKDFVIPPIPLALKMFVNGDYKVKGTLHHGGEVVACYEGIFSIQS